MASRHGRATRRHGFVVIQGGCPQGTFDRPVLFATLVAITIRTVGRVRRGQCPFAWTPCTRASFRTATRPTRFRARDDTPNCRAGEANTFRLCIQGGSAEPFGRLTAAVPSVEIEHNGGGREADDSLHSLKGRGAGKCREKGAALGRRGAPAGIVSATVAGECHETTFEGRAGS